MPIHMVLGEVGMIPLSIDQRNISTVVLLMVHLPFGVTYLMTSDWLPL